MWERVNALHRASFISTVNERLCKKQNGSVSIPFIGLPSFLRFSDSHSFLRLLRVNALHRVSFISTYMEYLDVLDENGCQCPMSGFLHFYPAILEPSIYAAFQPRFLQVIVWIFWKPAFFTSFSSCLQFRHILFCLFDSSSPHIQYTTFLLFWKAFSENSVSHHPKGQQETFFHLSLFNQLSIFKQRKQLIILVYTAPITSNPVFNCNLLSVCIGTVYSDRLQSIHNTDTVSSVFRIIAYLWLWSWCRSRI